MSVNIPRHSTPKPSIFSADAIRTILAKHIIAMAEEGERDRQRLIQGALARLKL